jgi:uncharacterized LabA/DUF88 family protein
MKMKKKIHWKRLKRAALFVDAANIFYSQKTLGWRVDYRKFLDFFKSRTNLVYAGFYSAGVKTDKRQQSDFDVKIAIDLVLMARKFDSVIMVSGDSDFEPALKYLKEKKKKIIVISNRGHVSKELIKLADRYIPLETLKNYIVKSEKSQSPK